MNWIDKAFGMQPQTISLLSRRSAVLASNIANANTENYFARDIDFRSVLKGEQLQQKVGLTRTNDGHMGPKFAGDEGSPMYRVPTKPMANGNTVEAEVEQAAFAENALRYQTSLTFLSGTISGLKLAINGK